MRVYPNPVWIKRGAVQPHNYNATRHTSQDSKRNYAHAARSAGKTLGDILQECKQEAMFQKLIRAK
jgi:hypothetical protein